MSPDESPPHTDTDADARVRSRQLLNRGSFMVPKERIKVERTAGVANREPVRRRPFRRAAAARRNISLSRADSINVCSTS